MTTATNSLLEETARYLEQEQHEILGRWVQRVSRIPIYLQRPETRLQELRDRMPLVLAELYAALPRDVAEAASRGAQSHARDRYVMDIPAAVIVKEYQVLRDEIWVAIEGWPRIPALSAADVFVLQRQINMLLDDVIATTLATFVSLEKADDAPHPASGDDPGGR
jgi:hypothetical protein